MCHHLLCSALTQGADNVSGSGPVLLCQSGVFFLQGLAHVEDVLIVLSTGRLLRFAPIERLCSQPCFGHFENLKK